MATPANLAHLEKRLPRCSDSDGVALAVDEYRFSGYFLTAPMLAWSALKDFLLVAFDAARP